MADQAAKFESILASSLKRLWILHRYDEMADRIDLDAMNREVKALERQVAAAALPARVREALVKKLEIQRELGRTVERNAASREALAAEIDSLEALLHLLLQKSVAASDPTAFSAEIDDALHHFDADAASVQEMEALVTTLGPTVGSADTIEPRGPVSRAGDRESPPPSRGGRVRR